MQLPLLLSSSLLTIPPLRWSDGLLAQASGLSPAPLDSVICSPEDTVPAVVHQPADPLAGPGRRSRPSQAVLPRSSTCALLGGSARLLPQPLDRYPHGPGRGTGPPSDELSHAL